MGWQSLSQNALVQGFLFYPDGSVDGETPPVLATQHVLAELGRVHAASTRCRHTETFLEKALQNLKTRGRGEDESKEKGNSNNRAAMSIESDLTNAFFVLS